MDLILSYIHVVDIHIMDLILHEVNPFFRVASVSFILLGADALH